MQQRLNHKHLLSLSVSLSLTLSSSFSQAGFTACRCKTGRRRTCDSQRRCRGWSRHVGACRARRISTGISLPTWLGKICWTAGVGVGDAEAGSRCRLRRSRMPPRPSSCRLAIAIPATRLGRRASPPTGCRRCQAPTRHRFCLCCTPIRSPQEG